MLLKGFFRTQSSNPDWPTEEWTLVEQITTPGSYSTTLGWGRYKIELSGAGGSGGASSSAHASYLNYANNGAAGKLFTAVIEVALDNTRTITGVIGSGGKSCTARGYDNGNGSYSVGAAGTGATNGTKGTGQVVNTERIQIHTITSSAAAGGSGGGSTSAVGIGTAAGGAGGNCRALNSSNQHANGTGGAGGSGSNQGNGASGGAGKFGYDALATSGAGSNGWVKIYKSNVYPEPI